MVQRGRLNLWAITIDAFHKKLLRVAALKFSLPATILNNIFINSIERK